MSEYRYVPPRKPGGIGDIRAVPTEDDSDMPFELESSKELSAIERHAKLTELGEVLTSPPVPARLSLYDITDALTQIDEMLEESGGDLTPEVEARLDALRGKFSEKVDNICILRQQRIRAAEACEAEAERLTKRAKSARRGADRLRNYLMVGVIRSGLGKVKTPRFTVWLQSSPIAIRWTKALEELPARFVRIKREVNIEEAQEARKAGEELPDGFIITQGQHIRIS